MSTAPRQHAMGFTEEKFPAGTHICLIYNNDNERRRLIARFLEAGFHEHEKVAYFADTMTTDEVHAWLAAMDVELPQGDQFVVTGAVQTYCPGGKFIPDEMLNTLRAFYEETMGAGYPGGRVSGQMSWALRGIPGSDRLMEYEALVNDVLVTHPITAICQYDVRRFNGATILDVLKVHPMMIVHGLIVRNPYFMKPQEFLSQARWNRTTQPG